MPGQIVSLTSSGYTAGVRITWRITPLIQFVILFTFLVVPITRSEYFSAPKIDPATREEVVCGDKDIRNSVESFKKLEDCTVIEGYLQILLIDRGVPTDYESLSFPKLREVTGFFLLYRAIGLKSLSKLFPNLSVIRGTKLFHNYAFVIYEMMTLKDIGLPSLTHILRGSVHIEKNPHLCYVDTIDWDLIAPSGKGGHYIKDNKDTNQCPNDCPTTAECPMSKFKENVRLCWNQHHCQKVCDSSCGTRSCSNTGQCCSPQCLGGCTDVGSTDCFACSGVFYQGKCSESCPSFTYKYSDRRCIIESECKNLPNMTYDRHHRIREIHWKLHEELCLPECPSGYMEDENDRHRCQHCGRSCPKNCLSANVDSVAAAQELHGCTRINGALIIQISGGDNIVQELEENLKMIEEVDDFVKIVKSTPLVSLNFLKNLRKIHGNKKENTDYSLFVIDNPNLQELWDFKTRPKLEIVSGKVYFHLNPKLCLKKIIELKENSGLPDWQEVDVSNTSNGDRVACDIRWMSARIDRWSSTGVIIKWDNQGSAFSDYRNLLGYFVSYKEAPYKNISLYDGRDACGGDSWKVDVVQATNIDNDTVHSYEAHAISLLKPFTQYAVYIRTYTARREDLGLQSDIIYFTTLPDAPSSPLDLRMVSHRPNELVMTWLPPSKPRGNVTHYLVRGTLETDLQETLDRRNYCVEPLVNIPDKSDSVTKSSNTIGNKTLGSQTSNFDLQKLCKTATEKVDLKDVEGDAEFKIEFEDFIHNYVYVKRPSTSQSMGRDGRDRRSKTGANGFSSKRVTTLSSLLSTVSQSPSQTSATESSVNGTNLSTLSTPSANAVNGTNSSTTSRPHSQTAFQIEAKENTVTVKGLHHFSQYTVQVVACHDANARGNKLCSLESITTARTAALVGADAIDYRTVQVMTLNDTMGNVHIKWDEPVDPNGLIVTYQLEYKRTHLENYSSVPICITHKQYRENRGYTLSELGPGNYSVRIRATSLAGPGNWTAPPVYFFIKDDPSGLSPGEIAAIAAAAVIVVIVIIGVSLVVVVKKKYSQNIPNGVLYASINPEYISTGDVYVPDEWEVPREKITVMKELGQGSFGMVYAGIAKGIIPDQPEIKCAIKTVNENATVRERIEFLNEASVMKAFTSYHVLKLLGVVSKGQPTLVIMELMGRGDLKAYLRSLRPDAEGDECERQPPTLKTILQMASEIADGMAYLAAKKFVHRDLAARNCMVADDLTVKIGDFGMTRDIYETDYYRKGGKGLLPVRWMAPESLKDGVFTSLSDVWSFGVVLWEMATLASQPYQGLSNEQVLKYVIDGGIMERLEACPYKLYDLMTRCWQVNPKFRPTFMELVTLLLTYVRPNFEETSFYFSTEGERVHRNTTDVENVTPTTPLRSHSSEDVDNISDQNRNSETIDVDGDSNDYIDSDMPIKFDPPASRENFASHGDYNSDSGIRTIIEEENKELLRPANARLNVSDNKNGGLSNGHLYFQPPKMTEC